MGILSRIADPFTKKVARVNSLAGETDGLVVATRSLKSYMNFVEHLTNPTYGIDMNKGTAYGGAPDNVHNGTDNAYWTGSAVIGTWTFDSIAQAHGGTKSVDGTATVNGDIAQFAKGGDVVLTGYVAITGWIYITAWSTQGTKQLLIQGYDVGVGYVGISVNIGDYVNIGILGSWQQFAIPLTDMDLGGATIDALRLTVVELGPTTSPNFYIDDLQIEQTGAPLEYLLKPQPGTWYHVQRVKFIIADAFTGIITVAGATENASLVGLPYDALLAESALTIGVICQQIQAGESTDVLIIKQLSDILNHPGTELTNIIGDGTNTYLTAEIIVSEPIVLKSEDLDMLRVLIQEDLSGLLMLRVSVAGKVEVR